MNFTIEFDTVTKSKIKKAQSLLKSYKEYINSYNDIFVPLHDLKLHEIFYEFDDETYDQYFNAFCEISYADFREFLKDLYISENLMKYVGHTSKFNIKTEYGEIYNSCQDDYIDITEIIDTLYENNCAYDEYSVYDFLNSDTDEIPVTALEYDYNVLINKGENVYTFENDLDMFLDFIIEDLFKVTAEIIKPCIEVYNYIYDFKTNQVEYFKEFINANDFE